MDFSTIQPIVDMILAQATIWAPSLTATVGIIVSIAAGINKIKSALDDVRTTQGEIKQTTEFKQLHDDLRQAHLDNKEQKEMIEMLLDKITHMQGYYEKKKEEYNERTNQKPKN